MEQLNRIRKALMHIRRRRRRRRGLYHHRRRRCRRGLYRRRRRRWGNIPPSLQENISPPLLPEGESIYTPEKTEQFVFKHPFTMTASGPTACGKTYFVKTMLQNINKMYKPTPERIIWLYKRWQPLYDEIQRTVIPHVEFVQGIPVDLDKDSYIDPRVRNMIVLDYLMSTVVKDPRITDLFTEGSHHRNLSVVVLNQNLYFSKDPTQRRNCHYLVLFNNPVDKQSIMTLARQMYPKKTQYFLEKFENATKQPYGYLLIDLKTTTPEELRLRNDIFQQSNDSLPCADTNKQLPILNEIQRDELHLLTDTSSDRTYDQLQPKMISCDDCGVVLESLHDLQRHIKTWCPEKNPLKRKQIEALYEEIEPNKKAKLQQPLTTVATTDKNIQNDEDEVFHTFAEMARENNNEERQSKIEKYMKSGLSEDEATDKAEDKLRFDDWKVYMNKYATLIGYIMKLEGGKIHTNIMETVRMYIKAGYDEITSIRMTLKKYRHQLEEYLEQNEYNVSDSESDVDDDNESNDDSDEEDYDEEVN